MSTKNKAHAGQRIVIIGGVAGGASAAARLRRLDEYAEITLLERGPDVSFANCGLPYHIGGEISERSKLAVQTPESLRQQLAIQVRANTEAVAIDRKTKTVEVQVPGGSEKATVPYDKLILSPGACPLRPPLQGIDLPGIHTLRNLQDMDRIKAAAEKAESVLVVGAGFIGLEMAEQLIKMGKQVRLVELVDQVLPQMDPEMTKAVEQELLDHGVDLILGDGADGFAAGEGKGIRAALKSGGSIEADMVVLSIGVRPENGLAKAAGLELGERGHIKTNAHLQTSDPDIYAVGDACETSDPILGGPAAIPLGGPANRQGRSAADHIAMGDAARPYPGSIGTAIVRVFDIAAGVTGHSEKRLREMDVDYEKTIVTDFNHAGYFPGATHLTVKILWEKSSGRLLGGQANGVDGVDKRLDVLATAIKGKLSVEDLEHLELAYAPPFGSSKDPINIAGFSANNIRSGLYDPVYELPGENEGVQLLDARPAEMASVKPIPGAINIPYPQLRDRLGELDKNKPVVTTCALGKMSYFASRILEQNGFKVRSHIGGWKVAAPTQAASKPTNELMTQDQTTKPEEVLHLDATGLACPGPIMRVREAALKLKPGQILEITASDSGFVNDLPAFCQANDYECLEVGKEKGIVTGRIRKADTGTSASTESGTPAKSDNDATLVVFSGELDKAMAAYVIANGAVAMGGQATLFFTFWGLNVLRKDPAPAVQGKSFMDKMFGWMLP
ncbi:MAG TPA: FAD-dependent oxidoreductase, partial [Opitutales bacterium]|nr:FAD-dependent oxidoreductase [Opitutales bacterium]